MSDGMESYSDEEEARPVHKMTYEEIRAANIERNNQKMRELFGTDKVILGGVSVSVRPKAKTDVTEVKAKPTLAEMQNQEKEAFGRLLTRFPGRESEIRSIWGYLGPEFCPAPALLVHGPSGSGKSDICHNALVARCMPFVRVSCDAFSTQKQLMRFLWHEIARTQLSPDSDSSKKKQLDEGALSAKAPNNFSDLVTNLRTLLQSLCQSRFHDTSIAPRAKLCILLDNVDKADALEKGLTSRLLNLTELCHKTIKIVATMPILQRKPYPCILVTFSSYTEAQMKTILLYKLSVSSVGEGLSIKFQSVLNDVFPRLSTTTNHIGELFEVLCIMNELNKSPEGGTGNANNNSRNLSTGAANQFVLEQIQMPTLNMFGSREPKSKSNAKPTVVNGGNKWSWGDATTAVSKFQRLEVVGDVVDPESLRGKTGTLDLPLSVKYLLIAVFLASSNSKETDDCIFAMKQKGKRKKERIGTANDQSAETAAASARSFTLDRLLSIFAQIVCYGGISSLGGGERAALALGRSAGLPEPSWVADQIEAYYGDARLFSAISDLETLHFLVKGPGCTLERPVYVSTVPQKLATEVARSLTFDIDAYRSK